MATVRTEISEIVTGLGLFGYRDLERALAARPCSIGNVNDRVFDRLEAAYSADKHGEIFSRRTPMVKYSPEPTLACEVVCRG